MRYKVINESLSAHCCFVATVVDIQTPCVTYPGRGETICECFTRADAQRVARALNAEEDAVDMGVVDECVAAAKRGAVKMDVPEAVRYRHQHMEIDDILNRMSSKDMRRLSEAFRRGWSHPNYDPRPVDILLKEFKEKYREKFREKFREPRYTTSWDGAAQTFVFDGDANLTMGQIVERLNSQQREIDRLKEKE